eukprot:TRINITY_DN3581_c0_g1_i1.p1 TRINITY_DN3581_c0_g1~~TRINITY_DN3581_c0_g1_i1.p1  ORF type:complete len:278 (-),score=20.14 TRINITY_DN3581_c0_g1_i1:275-1054(-)
MKKFQIKNILTIDTVTPELDFSPLNVNHRIIQMTDEEDSLLFPYFTEFTDWLIHALDKNEACLVHCRHGVSRSVAMVTATIMKINKIDYQNALEIVKKSHPSSCPNPGFVKQLQLWNIMHYKSDRKSPNYRLFEFMMSASVLTKNTGEEEFDENCEYGFKCRKCRKKLFSDRDLVPHESMWWQPFSTQSFCHKGLSILPKSWIDMNCYGFEAKINCSCSNKLGMLYSKNNLNIICPCGRSMKGPSIIINSSRVDRFSLK